MIELVKPILPGENYESEVYEPKFEFTGLDMSVRRDSQSFNCAKLATLSCKELKVAQLAVLEVAIIRIQSLRSDFQDYTRYDV